MMHFDDISDDEIRIIGDSATSTCPPRKPFYRKWWFWAAVAAAIALLVTVLVLFLRPSPDCDAAVTEVPIEPVPVAPTIVKTEPATVLVRDTSVNDVPLRLYTPVNAVPELCIGIPDTNDKSLILALQAADIRADNKEIVGAFVLKGELLARGIAKKGFCAILDGKVQLGVAESTPLFEEAIDKEGYFFRQYPLVNYRKIVENKPKGKALRHALCELDGRIVVVSSLDKESFHDFAQALADLGVENAIYLVGSQAYGFSRSLSEDATDATTLSVWGQVQKEKGFENVNFIVWRKAE